MYVLHFVADTGMGSDNGMASKVSTEIKCTPEQTSFALSTTGNHCNFFNNTRNYVGNVPSREIAQHDFIPISQSQQNTHGDYEGNRFFNEYSEEKSSNATAVQDTVKLDNYDTEISERLNVEANDEKISPYCNEFLSNARHSSEKSSQSFNEMIALNESGQFNLSGMDIPLDLTVNNSMVEYLMTSTDISSPVPASEMVKYNDSRVNLTNSSMELEVASSTSYSTPKQLTNMHLPKRLGMRNLVSSSPITNVLNYRYVDNNTEIQPDVMQQPQQIVQVSNIPEVFSSSSSFNSSPSSYISSSSYDSSKVQCTTVSKFLNQDVQSGSFEDGGFVKVSSNCSLARSVHSPTDKLNVQLPPGYAIVKVDEDNANPLTVLPAAYVKAVTVPQTSAPIMHDQFKPNVYEDLGIACNRMAPPRQHYAPYNAIESSSSNNMIIANINTAVPMQNNGYEYIQTSSSGMVSINPNVNYVRNMAPPTRFGYIGEQANSLNNYTPQQHYTPYNAIEGPSSNMIIANVNTAVPIQIGGNFSRFEDVSYENSGNKYIQRSSSKMLPIIQNESYGRNTATSTRLDSIHEQNVNIRIARNNGGMVGQYQNMGFNINGTRQQSGNVVLKTNSSVPSVLNEGNAALVRLNPEPKMVKRYYSRVSPSKRPKQTLVQISENLEITDFVGIKIGATNIR